MLATIGALTIGSLAPTQILGRLEERTLRPQLRVLSNMVDTTRGMENMLPKVVQLWAGSSGIESRTFANRFAHLKQLQYG